MTLEELTEALAKDLALNDGWEGFDTAYHRSDTLNGNSPEEERENYRYEASFVLNRLKFYGYTLSRVI